MHVAAEAGMHVVHAFDAATCIGQQALAVAFADQAAEQLEVTAEVVGRSGRSKHEVAQAAW